MRQHNSLSLAANSRWYSRVSRVEELIADLATLKRRNIPFRILGQGSNVILQDFDGMTLTPALPGIAVSGNSHSSIVRVGAGVDWSALVAWCCSKGLYGLENLAMIPGSAGAAPVQNIGAYGLELSERILAVDVLDLQQKRLLRLPKPACDFGYRTSRFKHCQVVVCALYLQLGSMHAPVLNYPEVAAQAATFGGGHEGLYQAVCTLRKRKLPSPKEVPNVGSFFKNPDLSQADFAKLQARWPDILGFVKSDSGRVRVPAAQLVEACGWKGRGHGKAAVSSQHALVVINPGQACAEDVTDLAHAVRRDVERRFGVLLEQEPVLI